MNAGAALPPLREELRLEAGPRLPDGAPSWTLHDPLRQRFFRLGWLEVECLRHWGLGSPAAIAGAVAAHTPLAPSPEQVGALADFLAAQQLVRLTPGALHAQRLAQARAARPGLLGWLLHHYLFFRVPLLRPERWLAPLAARLDALYTRTMLVTALVALLLGLYLVGRQWESFTGTFAYFFSAGGLLAWGCALAGSKVLHELGHAVTARRLGVPVPTMGVAFLVLWPVLYTDTTAVWRHPGRRARLAVGAAGMAAELLLAIIATLAWSFLPDGPARSAAFVLASSGWIATLAINASPFMRFDGYFLLSDALDLPNLHERSFALARWQLRRWLFGLDMPAPEPFAPLRHAGLVAFAFATWAYRLVLFLGIALLVYHFAFKPLGIALMAVEIGWFIVRPLAMELRVWWRLRATLMASRRSLLSASVLGAAVLLAILPWHTSLELPATLDAVHVQSLHTPEPARLRRLAVEPGTSVAAGDVIAELEQPDLAAELDATGHRVRALREWLRSETSRLAAPERQQRVAEELAGAERAARGLQERQARLTLRAPYAGRVAALADGLLPGVWLSPRQTLAQIIDPAAARIEALVPEDRLTSVARAVADGAAARFHPDTPERPVLGALVLALAPAASRTLDAQPLLASVYGGPLAATRDAHGRLLPQTPVYRLDLQPAAGAAAPERRLRGTLVLEVEAEPLLTQVWRRIAAVLIRESGF